MSRRRGSPPPYPPHKGEGDSLCEAPPPQSRNNTRGATLALDIPKRCAHSVVIMIRILLAEDDTSMREYLARALTRVGYDVVAVGCGTEAIPLLKTEKFDLLLTDIVMPEMDGIELAQKASAIDPAIRVMFITGFAAVALQGGRTAPEAKLLSKPFHLKDLVAEVDRLFQSEDQHGRL